MQSSLTLRIFSPRLRFGLVFDREESGLAQNRVPLADLSAAALMVKT